MEFPERWRHSCLEAGLLNDNNSGIQVKYGLLHVVYLCKSYVHTLRELSSINLHSQKRM